MTETTILRGLFSLRSQKVCVSRLYFVLTRVYSARQQLSSVLGRRVYIFRGELDLDHGAYTPQQVANYFLDRAEEDSMSMTQLKLIKLVYIAYGWYLALTGEKLFAEPIEAWKHGPVIPSLYHEFKHFKSSPIVGRSEDVDLDDWEVIIPRIPDDDRTADMILSKVWAAYRRFRAWDLRNKTHEDGGPWHKVYQDDVNGIALRDEDIKEHYAKRIAQYLEASQRTQ